MSGTMTTRAKKRAMQSTLTAVDPQQLAASSARIASESNTHWNEDQLGPEPNDWENLEPTIALDSGNSKPTMPVCVMSPLTLAKSLPTSQQARANDTISGPSSGSRIPMAFSSNDDQRKRVRMDESMTTDYDWHSKDEPKPLASSDTIDSIDKMVTEEPVFEPIPNEYNIDESKFGIAEFESIRSESPMSNIDISRVNENDPPKQSNEIDDCENEIVTDDQIEKDTGIENNTEHGDFHDRLNNSELDDAILGDDQLAYDLAHNENGPWESPTQDKELAQLFMDELSDHLHVMFKRLRFESVDPDSDLYHEQYNLTITTMVSGGIIMGRPYMDEVPMVQPIMPILEQPQPNPTYSQANQRASAPKYGKTLKDKVILQKWRNRDLTDTGQTEIADQGIHINENGNAFIIKGGVADTNQHTSKDKGKQSTVPPWTGPALTSNSNLISSSTGPPNSGFTAGHASTNNNLSTGGNTSPTQSRQAPHSDGSGGSPGGGPPEGGPPGNEGRGGAPASPSQITPPGGGRGPPSDHGNDGDNPDESDDEGDHHNHPLPGYYKPRT
ncbi:hypothetical protein ARMGADRAFT_1034995 [Armillaria gallica]|uniref:Uncharacterized protein n=1 Tax=Armillaria gallica TaxID=47427 RepID=A0A2H3D6R7_ARMGA|nr:hypothetical protein ARMGADRAFT_1034995 [Armillaria gallica]